MILKREKKNKKKRIRIHHLVKLVKNIIQLRKNPTNHQNKLIYHQEGKSYLIFRK